MSVVINANQVNAIIYKYLLESGLSHTAYAMFNEAKLQNSLKQYKFDIKSGHLLSLIQKALLFGIVQSHFHIDQNDSDCIEPYSILKPHTCKIFQKKKIQYKNLQKQLTNNLNEAIKRTNAIYNTELTNKNYDQIVYQPRGVNYFQKFKKLKFADNQLEIQNYKNSLKISSTSQNQIAIYNNQDNIIYLAQNDSYQGDIIIDKIYLCSLNGKNQDFKSFKLLTSHLIILYQQNKVKIINRLQNDRSIQIIIPLDSPIISINNNPNFSSIISFQANNQYFILNTKNMEQISTKRGILKWRGYDQYIWISQQSMQLKSLLKQDALLSFQTQQMTVQNVQISINNNFFFISNLSDAKIYVYTFQKQEPLYIFDFSDQNQSLKKVIWISRNQIDYLVILTDLAIRVWEVQLNSYCLNIQLEKYDVGNIKSLISLQKNSTQTYLLALGSQNLLVSDVANQKIQRIQTPKFLVQMANISKNQVYLTTNQNIYFLTGQKMAELFK